MKTKEARPIEASFVFDPHARYSVSEAACFALFGKSPDELAHELAVYGVERVRKQMGIEKAP